ncbi:hypothetical protein LKV13_01555 [Borrelia sp. BU AG58]|uniref:hypothetical protein n=1 Tax=Borrelia sp. BU AG58 TaxID=2887345 RepID=UPI001E3A092B|nr:hypothetical protein [Borrelia sp. BU AG58]UER67496.1 hypothetical protein LKV13_01555 [Borrelia sp. BU AG58]
MDLIDSKDYQKILFIDNLVLKTFSDIKEIKESGKLSLDPEATINFINLNLNALSYIASLNYFYTRPRLKVNYNFKRNLFNVINDLSLFVSPILLDSPSDLISRESVVDLDPRERFLIVRKLGYLIDLGMYFNKGDSKSIFFLEDMYLKFIVFVKNFIDFKNLTKNLIIDSPFYKAQLAHLVKSLELLEEGAFLLKVRYESNKVYVFSRQALNYMQAGKILATVTSQNEIAEKFSKFYDVWSAKFQSDLSNAD